MKNSNNLNAENYKLLNDFNIPENYVNLFNLDNNYGAGNSKNYMVFKF